MRAFAPRVAPSHAQSETRSSASPLPAWPDTRPRAPWLEAYEAFRGPGWRERDAAEEAERDAAKRERLSHSSPAPETAEPLSPLVSAEAAAPLEASSSATSASQSSSPDHPLEREAEATSTRLVDALESARQRERGVEAPGFFARSLGLGEGAARLHQDAGARALAARHGAKAVTIGRDVHFGASSFDLSNRGGLSTLAHEMVHVAQHARSPVATRGVAWRQEAGAAEDELGASIFGLTITFAPGSGLPASATIVEAMARLLRRLAGVEERRAAELAQELVHEYRISLGGAPTTPTAPTQERDGPVPAAIESAAEARAGYFVLEGDVAHRVVSWLDEHGVPAALTGTQRSTLKQAYYARVAYGMRERYSALATLDRETFLLAVSRRGAELDAFGRAYDAFERTRSPEADFELSGRLFSLLLYGYAHERLLAKLQEDASLGAHPTYRALFPMGAGTEVDGRALRARFLAYADAVPELVLRTGDPEPIGRRARVQLLDGFLPSVQAQSSRESRNGDVPVSAEPSSISRPSLPATITTSPSIEGPTYRAVAQSEYAFTMTLSPAHASEAHELERYRYHWDVAPLPLPAEAIGASDPRVAEPAARALDRVLARADEDGAGLDFERDAGQADVGAQRAAWDRRYEREERAALDGASGLGDELTLRAARLFRTSASHDYAADPASPTRRFVFRRPGAFLVRGRAGMVGDRELRAPSVAHQAVVVFAGTRVARDDLRRREDEHARMQARVEQLRALAGVLPDAEQRAALEAEIRRLSDPVGLALDEQRALLEARLAEVPEFLYEHRRLRDQLAAVDAILETRAERAAELPTGSRTERLPASFVTDAGERIGLLFEVSRTPDGYVVSDLTTRNSTRSTVHRGERRRAILASVYEILSGSAGYGTGTVAVEIAGAPSTMRIRRSAGQLRREAIDNSATVLQLAAIAAAPVTDGASLLALPLIGGVQGLYGSESDRLLRRSRDHTLALDLESVSDAVNVLGAFAGVGELAATTRLQRLARAGSAASQSVQRLSHVAEVLRVLGQSGDAVSSAIMARNVLAQLDAIASMPAEDRADAFRRMLVELAPSVTMLGASVISSRSLASRQAEARQPSPEARGDREPGFDSFLTSRGVPVRSAADMIAGDHDVATLVGVLPEDIRHDVLYVRTSGGPDNSVRVRLAEDGVRVEIGANVSVDRMLAHVDAIRAYRRALQPLGRLRRFVADLAVEIGLLRRGELDASRTREEIDLEISKLEALHRDATGLERWALDRIDAHGARADVDLDAIRAEIDRLTVEIDRQRARLPEDGAFGHVGAPNTISGSTALARLTHPELAALLADDEGYYWTTTAEGRLTIASRNVRDFPTRRFVPLAAGEAIGTFDDHFPLADANVVPARFLVDGLPDAQREYAPGPEVDGRVRALVEQRRAAVDSRDAAERALQALLARSGLTEDDLHSSRARQNAENVVRTRLGEAEIEALRELRESVSVRRGEVSRLSEQIGVARAEDYVELHYPGARRLFGDAETAGRPGEFDLVYRLPSGQILIIEAKGGSSGLGTRDVQGRAHQQGTRRYVQDVAYSMLERTPPGELREGLEMLSEDPGSAVMLLLETPLSDHRPRSTRARRFDLSSDLDTP